jgi:hypothetical protein
MKKTFLLLSFAVCAVIESNAQTPPQVSNCYTEYYTAFRDRGSKAVPDGPTDVVVSIRKDNFCTCFMGKITVKNGKPVNDLKVAREDGTYQRFYFVPHAKYNSTEGKILNYISNGMSPGYMSSNEELINLFFINYLNDIPAKYKTAPAILNK